MQNLILHYTCKISLILIDFLGLLLRLSSKINWLTAQFWTKNDDKWSYLQKDENWTVLQFSRGEFYFYSVDD